MRVLRRLVPAIVLAAALAGCSATDDRIESRLRSELPRVLGPADRYEVDVKGVDAGAGSADRVTVVGYGIHPRQGPALDRLELDLRGVRYDRHAHRIDRVGDARATAWVSAADLSDFVQAQDGVGAATVTLAAPDSVYVRLRPDLGGLPVPPGASLEVAGYVEAKGPFVEYRVTGVTALGGRLGDSFVRRISRLINPIVDLSALPMRLEVTRVQVEGRTLRLEAAGAATAVRP